MTSENNKTITHRWFEATIAGDQAIRADLMRADCLHHLPGMPPLDGAAHSQLASAFLAAFPDLHSRIEETLAEGDSVVLRASWSGTHQGTLMGLPPTGKQVQVKELHFFRMANGQIIEHWINYDQIGMLQQLGAIPTLAGA